MYEIIQSVIAAGGYKLSALRDKIKKLYVMGDLTEEQTDALLLLASQGVSADAERPQVLTILRNLSARIDSLEAKLAGSGTAQPAYENWLPWDGISDRYPKGAVVQHGDRLWVSVYDGQNVWEPGTAGTEALWTVHIPQEA